MFEQVRQAGFIEGQNLTVNWRTYGTHVELVSQFASELFKSPVDVIIVGGDPATKAAQKATTTIPILAFTDDWLGWGSVGPWPSNVAIIRVFGLLRRDLGET